MNKNDMAAVGRFMNVGNGKLNCYIIRWIDLGNIRLKGVILLHIVRRNVIMRII